MLAEEESVVHGWIAVGKARDGGPPDEGEVYALYVRPEHWRSGVGRTLMSAGEQELWTSGFTRSALWVLERNLPARAFYESAGYTLDGQRKEISFGETSLVELRYWKRAPSPTPPV